MANGSWDAPDSVMGMYGWPEDWERKLAGQGCPMCDNLHREETEFGVRFVEGSWADVYLQRRSPLAGYAIAIWKRGHVAEPTELDEASAAGYWNDTLAGARALSRLLAPYKMNYLTMGNAVPHLHTHLLPRHAADPAPGKPFPWHLMEEAPAIPEPAFSDQVSALRDLVRSGEPYP
jgi:diadenosine tetraphosphate (Ap4A) HIT family hydrolase